MPRSRWLLYVVLSVAPLVASCTRGNECDRCETDEDCQEGFVCSTFEDDSRRCGTGTGATTCRVR
jgi:hypothetical protein